MDVNRALRSAVQTGEVQFGLKEALKALDAKKAKLVIIAANAPEGDVEKVESAANKSNVPVYKFSGTNAELGPAAGRPFSMAFLSVLDAGESDVLHLARAKS